MAHAYLFNPGAGKLKLLRVLFIRLGISFTVVPREHFGRPLCEITGRGGCEAEFDELPDFTDEILLMDGFDSARFHALLDSMKSSRATIALKAVTTERNLFWTPRRLHAELSAEREAMRSKTPLDIHKTE